MSVCTQYPCNEPLSSKTKKERRGRMPKTDKCAQNGKILSGVGGLYKVLTEDERILDCRARGNFRFDKISPYPGDNVTVTEEKNGASVIDTILPRKNIFEKPPAANIDLLFITVATATPSPSYITVDKLAAAAEYYGAQTVIIVTKSDLDPDKAKEISEIYGKSGYKVFVTSSENADGVSELLEFVKAEISGKTAFFAGESGVGKSSLLNALFPALMLKTGEVSRKIYRGKHTTRAVTLYPLDEKPTVTGAFLADTPGFGIFDLSSISNLMKEDIEGLFPEFAELSQDCKYRKCTHLREEGCEVIKAVEDGKIARERHESFVKIYEEIKLAHPFASKKTEK